eukprot:7388-Heterococcus_DN1.PRE.2
MERNQKALEDENAALKAELHRLSYQSSSITAAAPLIVGIGYCWSDWSDWFTSLQQQQQVLWVAVSQDALTAAVK